jgi:hypothetical protein
MFFRVENLGPLRSAEVDLSKDLILLTGPNSTGKTYLAWSVYGLFRAPAVPQMFRKLVKELLNSPEQGIEFARFISVWWPNLVEAIAARLTSRLHLCFAADRQSFPNVKISIRLGSGEPEFREPGMFPLLLSGTDFLARVSLNSRIAIELLKRENVEGASVPRPPLLEPTPFAQIPADVKSKVTEELEANMAWLTMSNCWPQCTLLPTERTAVDLFARELSIRRADLVNRVVDVQLSLPVGDDFTSAQLGVAARDVGRYPWPIQDSLRAANDIVYTARQESEFADLAIELETLLGGAVTSSKDGAVGFKPMNGPGEIGIHLTSSVVKSLVSLVFFLRHSAQKGNLLMIDEPELNLHPDNQRKIARVLVKAVNRGLRLIMSTHSDYFLRELNNLIILSRDTKPIREIRAKHGYADSELLAPAKVGVYLFKDGTAADIPVTEDGFEVQSIEDEINRMNAMSQEIYAAINE